MTLNLIRLVFDPSRSEAIRIIGNPYRLHQFVYETMSAGGNPGRILYRLEANYGFHNPEPCVLVQVEHSVVPQINDRCWGKPDFVRMESKSSAGVLREAGVYRFRSRVNPVRSEPPRSTGGRGKRMGIADSGEQVEWFSKRLSDKGMRLMRVDHRRESWLEVRQKTKQDVQKSRRLVFASAFFEGVLEVTNAESAEKAVLEGIGPGKGFGFGMISLARR